jgi:hypothetical protein
MMTTPTPIENAYLIQAVHVISAAKEVAFVITEDGGYVIEAVPEVGQDVREFDILFVARTLEEGIEKYENVYG